MQRKGCRPSIPRTRSTWPSAAAAPTSDSPTPQVAAYIVKQSNGQFENSGTPFGVAPYGIALPKGNGMAKAVLAAMKELISDGTYTKLLAKWGIQAGAVTSPVIDGATS